MKRQKGHLFAVVRIDHFLPGPSALKDRITVKEVVMTQESAEKEVVRLSKLQENKGCEYFWQTTRLIIDN